MQHISNSNNRQRTNNAYIQYQI